MSTLKKKAFLPHPVLRAGTRPSSIPHGVAIRVDVDAPTFIAQLEALPRSVCIDARTWAIANHELYKALQTHPMYAVPIQNAESRHKSAIHAIRRIETTSLWHEALCLTQDRTRADARLQALINHGVDRLRLRFSQRKDSRALQRSYDAATFLNKSLPKQHHPSATEPPLDDSTLTGTDEMEACQILCKLDCPIEKADVDCSL